jgi:hypothetical protein
VDNIQTDVRELGCEDGMWLKRRRFVSEIGSYAIYVQDQVTDA